ncbi:MAG: hypothetical protein WC789_09265 [Lentisphaeria bacterium]
MCPQPLDLQGRRFGRWLVLQQAVSDQYGRKWHCRCLCGVERAVKAASLRSGASNSCGCLKREQMVARRTHGLSKTPIYKRWAAMIARCEDSHGRAYHNYGARGITVCPRWRDSVEAFIEDMGAPPSPAHTIERVDNSKGYEPGNCTWVLRRAQNRNKRTNQTVTFNGETLCLRDWATRLGLKYGTLRYRIVAAGWPVAAAFSAPDRRRAKHRTG